MGTKSSSKKLDKNLQAIAGSRRSVVTLPQQYVGPMSEKQVALLRDMQAFIDAAIDNGLSFATTLGVLSHDVNNIARYGWDLQGADKDGFTPNVTGYTELTEDSVGAVREDEE